MTTGQSPQKLTVDASTAPLSASTTHYSYEESDGHRTPVGVAPPAPFTAPAASDDGDLNKPEPCQFPNISMNLPEPVLGRSVSTSRERAQMLRKGDNIELLRVEKVVSRADSQSRHHDIYRPLGSTHNLGRSETPIDELSDSTGPTNGGRKGAWKPPAQPSNSIAKFIKKVRPGLFLPLRLGANSSLSGARVFMVDQVFHIYCAGNTGHCDSSHRRLDQLSQPPRHCRRCLSSLVHGLDRDYMA